MIKNNKINLMSHNKIILSVFFFIFIASCDHIQYSTHELIDSDILYNEYNLKNISVNGLKDGDIFSFALVTDSHFGFDRLQSSIEEINKEKPDFTIHLGDITDNGLTNEYKISNDIMKKLDNPFLVLLGNHDTLATGKEIFRNLYGPTDYSFIYKNSKFIIINSNSWEFIGKNVPNLDWLEKQLSNSYLYEHIFVFAHISPFTRGFDEKKSDTYRNLMKKYNVTYSIHGHSHHLWQGEYYNDGIKYFLVDDVQDHNYTMIYVKDNIIDIKLKTF